jgi:hypothetical protein
MAWVRLTAEFSPATGDQLGVGRLRVIVVEADGIEPEVFRYQQAPLVPGATVPLAAFDGVCSPTDMSEFPVDAPIPTSTDKFFRLGFIDMICVSRTEANNVLTSVLEELNNLTDAVDLAEELEPATEYLIGTVDSDSGSG